MARETWLITVFAAALFCAAVFAAGHALAEEELADEEKAETVAQTTGPVMGGKINKDVFADHAGKRVYFCCPGCTGVFEKDPAKYIAKLEDAGVTLDTPVKPQTTCPVMGGKINKDVFADHAGKRVYFCCPGCSGAFEKDPAKYVKKLEDQGITLEDVIKPVENQEGALEEIMEGEDEKAGEDGAAIQPRSGCGGCGRM